MPHLGCLISTLYEIFNLGTFFKFYDSVRAHILQLQLFVFRDITNVESIDVVYMQGQKRTIKISNGSQRKRKKKVRLEQNIGARPFVVKKRLLIVIIS